MGVAHAELVELDGLLAQALVVAAADDQQHRGRLAIAQRALGAAQDVAHLVVGGGHAGHGVDKEQHGIGAADGHLGLAADLLDVVGRIEAQRFAAQPAGGIDAARVDHVEDDAAPFGFGHQPVAGCAGAIINDRQALPGQAVEER